MYLYGWVHVCVGTCGDLKLSSSVALYCFEAGEPQPTHSSPILAGLLATLLRVSPCLPPKCWIISSHHSCLAFYMGAGDLTPVLHLASGALSPSCLPSLTLWMLFQWNWAVISLIPPHGFLLRKQALFWVWWYYKSYLKCRDLRILNFRSGLGYTVRLSQIERKEKKRKKKLCNFGGNLYS